MRVAGFALHPRAEPKQPSLRIEESARAREVPISGTIPHSRFLRRPSHTIELSRDSRTWSGDRDRWNNAWRGSVEHSPATPGPLLHRTRCGRLIRLSRFSPTRSATRYTGLYHSADERSGDRGAALDAVRKAGIEPRTSVARTAPVRFVRPPLTSAAARSPDGSPTPVPPPEADPATPGPARPRTPGRPRDPRSRSGSPSRFPPAPRR